jgi:hypothetical protein
MRRVSVSLSCLLAVFVAVISACGGDDATPTPDAGVPVDAPPDAPYVPLDGGPTGAALLPTDACDDLVDSLYVTPAGLSPFDASVRGALLGCASIETITSAHLATRLAGVPGLVFSGGDVRVYVIAYRTEREPRGTGGISTALVYLPDVARSERVPLVVVDHGALGLADACAPSRFMRSADDPTQLPKSYLDALFLSFAARGLPVVAPDYAGLGTDGTHDFGNWLDPARSVLDGARALRSLLPAERLDGGTILYGHSQGGGISLAAAALASEAPDLDLRAVVSAAPGYRYATTSADLVRLSSVPLSPFLVLSGATMVYSDYANLTADPTRWSEPFAPALRDRVAAELDAHCFIEAGTNLATAATGYTPPTTVGELVDPAFAAAVGACMDSGSCDGLPGAFVARDAANEPHLSAESAPLLLLSSAADEIATQGPFGCVLARLRTEGAPHESCTVSTGDHLEMVSGTNAYAIEWALATESGAARPPCTGSVSRPRCSLF